MATVRRGQSGHELHLLKPDQRRHTGVLDQHGPRHGPGHGGGPAPRTTSPSRSDQITAYQDVSKLLGADIPYVWYDRTVWAIGAESKVENFANPSGPDGSKAFALIGGAIWPTQIWLNS